MQVTIQLLVTYRRYLPAEYQAAGKYVQDVAPGTRAGDVVAGLPIPPQERSTFLVNGRHAEPEQLLCDGDTLLVFPAVGGGSK